MAAQESPSIPLSTPVDGVNVLGSLSPSRAGDFLTCPLLYRFRTIDRLPEPFSVDAMRGTLVHKVLEELFDLPAADRTPEQARDLLVPGWEQLLEAEPELAEMFTGEGPAVADWLGSCRAVLDRYFTLEDPTRIEPAEREVYVEAVLDSKLLLRGFVDRLDVAPDGALRIVDYKGLAADTPLPTPTGWTTMGRVEVGDSLLGRDGRPTLVTRKSRVHHRPCYRVTFADGSTIVSDNVHLWAVVHTHRQRQTRQIIDSAGLHELHERLRDAGCRQSLWVEAADPIDLPEIPLPADPWLLGAWLGDGATRGNRFTVGSTDFDDMLTLFKQHWPRSIRVQRESGVMSVALSRWEDRCTYGHNDFKPATPGHPTRRCAHEAAHGAMSPWNLPFGADLDRAGVRNNKHIPPIYLRAGTAQRIDLLRGLMDTDGWWNKTRHRAGFTTTSDVLARDVLELLASLGVTPLHFAKPYTNATRPNRTWHVIEFTPRHFNPFTLPRKAEACTQGVTDLQRDLAGRRVIRSVEPVPSVPTQCIAVDAHDSLFLCGTGFIPTHNTGRAPGEGWEAKALFQMKFYALVLWRTRGVVPAMLQLVYLGSGELIRYVPDERELLATERKVEAIWSAIARATETRDWRPRRSRLCDWCAHQAICPEFGGTPPPLPDVEPADPGELTAEDVD